MSVLVSIHQDLYRLYEHYVGEPDSSADVYGYYLFIAGYLLCAVGVGSFVVSYAGDAESFVLIQVSTVIAATGAAIGLFGIVLMLPVRTRAIQASVVGLVVALVGVALFAVVYPEDWRGFGADYSVEVISIYSLGIGIIAGVTALVPFVTGERGMFVEAVSQSDDPAILTGEALEGAQFAVFRDDDGDWAWHVLHLEALAAGAGSAVTRPDATAAIDRVKGEISAAGLLELTTSAFRLYESRDGTWQWTLVREDGSVVGEATTAVADRSAAEDAVSFCKDRGPEADVISIEPAAYTYETDRDEWYWTLIDDELAPLARSARGQATQQAAETAADGFASRFEDARVLDIDHVGIELLADDEWRWRLVDRDDSAVLESADTVGSRRDAEAAVEDLVPEIAAATVLVAGEPSYEVVADDGWQWRLVDQADRVVARSPPALDEREAVVSSAEGFKTGVSNAEVVEIDDAAYEIYPVDAGRATVASGGPGHEGGVPARADGGAVAESQWGWRLVTTDRDVLAASADAHASADDAGAAIERVREQASDADLLEFDHAAFQVYEADDSEWRWRLIDENGAVLADSGAEHTSREEATNAMVTLKEEAPEAELLEIETAAFELFVTDGAWSWRLIDEAGRLVAADPDTHPTRDDAHAAMERLLAHLAGDVRTMDRPIVQPYADDEWHWRVVQPSGETVAVSADGAATRDELLEAFEAIRPIASDAQRHEVGAVAIQCYGADEWRFRLLDRHRQLLADAPTSYPDREAVHAAVGTLRETIADAPVFSIDDSVVRLRERTEGWSWELVDSDREPIATGVEPVTSKGAVFERIERIRQLAPLAHEVDFDVASFELAEREDGRWRWRLLDEHGHPVATGTETVASKAALTESLPEVREVIADASILEIDEVSFELHVADDGGWVWELVDQYGETMATSTESAESRTAAREAMADVKRHAPDGWVTFTE